MSVPMGQIKNKVVSMANYGSDAKRFAQKHKLDVVNVTWEDTARQKGSCWGPNISDMTLQVGGTRMPVIREPNFTDTTWDVAIEKVPVVVGNEKGEGTKLTTVNLKEYLLEMHKYMTTPPFNDTLNMLVKDPSSKQKDTHVMMSSQCCFLPIEKTKETKFNVALYNYQSKKADPAVLVIVSTSKGTSAQIIEGNTQKLLFNNWGKKADFVGQRLTDNRRERGVALEGEMSREEKQDNVIVIVQVPLKQKPKPRPVASGGWGDAPSGGMFDLFGGMGGGGGGGYGGAPMMACESFASAPSAPMQMSVKKLKKKRAKSKRSSSRSVQREEATVEAAIVKVSVKTVPECKCGADLVKMPTTSAYGPAIGVNCDVCANSCPAGGEVYHCPKGKGPYQHRGGYDLCLACGEKQLDFDELNGLAKIERDEQYPIRVTLQYYKSTDNGVVNADIMAAIAAMLKASRKSADFVGSLVTGTDVKRPTEWVEEKQEAVQPGGAVEKGTRYETVGKLLNGLGIYDTYIGVFKENEVDDECFGMFEGAGDLKEIMPKLGHRTKLWKAWEKHKSADKRQDVDFLENLAF